MILWQTEAVTVAVQKQPQEVTAGMEKHAEGMLQHSDGGEAYRNCHESGCEHREQPDVFRLSFDVPDNPPHVVQNFGSASEAEQGVARPLTIEG